MQAAFDAPGLAVELQPLGGVEVGVDEVGNEADLFRLVALEMSAEASDLRRGQTA